MLCHTGLKSGTSSTSSLMERNRNILSYSICFILTRQDLKKRTISNHNSKFHSFILQSCSEVGYNNPFQINDASKHNYHVTITGLPAYKLHLDRILFFLTINTARVTCFRICSF